MSDLHRRSGQFFAHTVEGTSEGWETIPDHLEAVGKLARLYAEAFKAGPWGQLLGDWHDLGKYSQEFQDYLSKSGDPNAGEEQDEKSKRVDHSTFGARHAKSLLPNESGHVLAYCIAGHHAGLPDAGPISLASSLTNRLDDSRRRIPDVVFPPEIVTTPVPSLSLPFSKGVPIDDIGFTLAFFTRMLFSCLIDADRTATEAFCDRAQSEERNRPKPKLEELRSALNTYLADLSGKAPTTHVNTIRSRVLADCIAAAEQPPGFFSLNVPTGGGKTLASLAFALQHAEKHPQFRRVVVGIPFTSIIEQTADVYRRALGDDLVNAGALVEHHSSPNPRTESRTNKLATENWDAPLVVTTNVQLFETLFASRTTPSRKLHRLANSVIILDEAQTLPVDLLQPTLGALRELVARYGCSVVLCTATQPALEKREPDFQIGLTGVREIVKDVDSLHTALKRVDVTRIGKLDDDELATRLSHERQVLCIVNTKAHAADVYTKLVTKRGKVVGCYHLSTFMCAEHRRHVLAEIRERLKAKKSCRVVSTQLIEAGVDVDFPCVYRAPAGFDAIAQAAGRCNREGKLTDAAGNSIKGRVFVFDTDRAIPRGLLLSAAQAASELIELHPDPLQPSAVQAYFNQLYWSRKHTWDQHEVMANFALDPSNKAHRQLVPFQFRTASQSYRLIREEQTPVLVPYGDEAKSMIQLLKMTDFVDYQFLRTAQKYTVAVREDLLRKLADNQSIVPHESGLWYLGNEDAYSEQVGLLPNIAGLSPESLMA